MKKQVYFFALLLITGCQKKEVAPEPLPQATFNTTSKGYGEYAFNLSATNAASYSWDFGDGSTSREISPSHLYSRNSIYPVILTATGKGGSTVATRSINVVDVPGTATFWMSSGKHNVDVTVDDKYLATITVNNGSKPSCSAAGTASFTFLSEGIHPFTAKEKDVLFPASWKGSISVVGGQCSTQQLVY